MNAKSVLSKIATLLSLDNEEVLMTDARMKDGTILQSKTFDVGEKVDVVGEDGEKTPAPDGEHEIALRDSEGKEVLIKITTKDGEITERENVELEEDKEKKEEEDMKEDDKDEDKKEMKEEEMADASTETAKGLPNTTEEDKSNEVKTGEASDDPIISLGYRIDEMEKKMKMMEDKFASAFPAEGMEVSSLVPSMQNMSAVEEDEEELPKLDGAPIELLNPQLIEKNKQNFGKKEVNAQANFLSKLYR